MSLIAILVNIRPVHHRVRALLDRRSQPAFALAPRSTQVHRSIHDRSFATDYHEPRQACFGFEGDGPARLELPADSAVYSRFFV